jgi:hypothetical protein
MTQQQAEPFGSAKPTREREDGTMSTSTTLPNEQPSPKTTVGELRQKYGPHFAAGYGDQDTLGEILGRAGVATLDEYLAQSKRA